MLRNYFSINRSPIIGTFESLNGCAKLNGIHPDGQPDHEGETEVIWDNQQTVVKDGHIQYLDEDGGTWPFHELGVYHGFAESGDAYDATQCDARILSGDALVIIDEGVVGLAYTWPVAVTKNHGNLHNVATDVKGVAKDAEWTEQQVRYALTVAKQLGFEIDPIFAEAYPDG